MNKGLHKSTELTEWGNSLLNKLSALTRNRRKRNASKRRRVTGKKEIENDIK